jgi:hypothetical protein
MKHWRQVLLGLIALTLAPTLCAANPVRPAAHL